MLYILFIKFKCNTKKQERTSVWTLSQGLKLQSSSNNPKIMWIWHNKQKYNRKKEKYKVKPMKENWIGNLKWLREKLTQTRLPSRWIPQVKVDKIKSQDLECKLIKFCRTREGFNSEIRNKETCITYILKFYTMKFIHKLWRYKP